MAVIALMLSAVLAGSGQDGVVATAIDAGLAWPGNDLHEAVADDFDGAVGGVTHEPEGAPAKTCLGWLACRLSGGRNGDRCRSARRRW